MLTADHGNDPTWRGNDHTREHVPILAFGGGVAPGPIGGRASLADIAATVAQKLGLPAPARGVELARMSFALDPRLAADTLPIGDLALSRALLMNDARYPWLILVPRRAGLSEIVDLDGARPRGADRGDRRRVRVPARAAAASTSSTSARSAISSLNCTSTSSAAPSAIPPGRGRSGASARASPTPPMPPKR